MNQGRTVFSQLVEFLPTYQFQICVDRYQGNRYVRDFSCWDQFLCLAFAQLTYRESLGDIEACLRAQQPKLYHMGFRGQVSRNTLAHANEHRDWRIYADFAQVLIAAARDLYRGESFGVELSETLYALDSTTIGLCLSLFPWGKFRRRKSAVKLHTLLDLRGSIATIVYVTGGEVPVKRKKRKKCHSRIWQLRVRRFLELRLLLKAIEPFCITKQKQIKAMVGLFACPRPVRKMVHECFFYASKCQGL